IRERPGKRDHDARGQGEGSDEQAHLELAELELLFQEGKDGNEHRVAQHHDKGDHREDGKGKEHPPLQGTTPRLASQMWRKELSLDGVPTRKAAYAKARWGLEVVAQRHVCPG